MPLRVTENTSTASFKARIQDGRVRIEKAQAQLASGKRINRPSDDPLGAQNITRMRAYQASLKQFSTNASVAREKLLIGDAAIDSYETLLDRAKVLTMQGFSDATTQFQRDSLATEIDGIRERLVALSNTRNGDEYVFGGTRQDVPPFARNGVDPNIIDTAAGASTQAKIQVEPGAQPVVTGVTSESIFVDSRVVAAPVNIFASLATISTSLRGTGNAAADKAAGLAEMDRLTYFSSQSVNARAQIGVTLNSVTDSAERLDRDYLLYEENISRIESVDFAEAAEELVQSEQMFDAIIQSGAFRGKRSLIDLLG